MEKVLNKLRRYFDGQFEFGVFKEPEGEKDGAVWAVEPNEESLAYLKAMNAQDKHIFVRPSFENESHFMLHDDVDAQGLARYHKDAQDRWKPGRLVVQSSPGNYQVWVKSERGLSIEEKKHWLGLMHSDPGASPLHRWGRAPGFRNRKEKYRTDQGYPLARLEWIDWKDRAGIPAVELQQEKRHTSPQHKAVRIRDDGQLPTRDRYYKGVDAKGKVRESEQDFAYMLALVRRGVDDETIKDRIRSERSDWENHRGANRMERYLDDSLKKAKSVIGSSGYTINIYDEKKRRLKSVAVGGVPAGQDHRTYLETWARDIVAKEGYEPSRISVDVDKVRRRQDKGKSMELNRPQARNASPR